MSVGHCVKYHGSVDASVVKKVKSVCLHFFWLRVAEIVHFNESLVTEVFADAACFVIKRESSSTHY